MRPTLGFHFLLPIPYSLVPALPLAFGNPVR
jgi:hypothetical protein